MLTLCKVYQVAEANYSVKLKGTDLEVEETEFVREIDFYLLNGNERHKCEVKLMGKGNPESADAVIARDSRVFVADKLSDLNKTQLNSLGVSWVELRSENGYQRFAQVLDELNIPHQKFTDFADVKLEKIFSEIMD